MKNIYHKPLVCTIMTIMLLLPATSLVKAAQQPDKKAAFKIRAYQQTLFLSKKKPLQFFLNRLDNLSKLGYNLVIFSMGHHKLSSIAMQPDGAVKLRNSNKAEYRRLIEHANKLGIELVFGMKFVGKTFSLLKPMLKKYPKLLINQKHATTVVNLNYKPDDKRNAYELAILPQIEFLLSLYPKNRPAKYFLLGTDEFHADDMAILAKSLDVTPEKAFAMSLEEGTEFLIKRNVTPIIWGDVLLSTKLSKSDSGITLKGYKPDSRLELKLGDAYNGDGYLTKKYNLFRMVNYLRNKNKIIVADWHYKPSSTGDFPSVDYFQQIGFKDVWGATWFREKNIRQFSRYAEKMKCGGMIATSWHLAHYSYLKPEFNAFLQDSLVYFENPNFKQPKKELLKYELLDEKGNLLGNEKATAFIPSSLKKITIKINAPKNFKYDKYELFIVPFKKPGYKQELVLKKDKSGKLIAVFELPHNEKVLKRPAQFMMKFIFTDSKTSYSTVNTILHGFVYGDGEAREIDTKNKYLLAVDFTKLTPQQKNDLWFQGTCATPIHIDNGSKKVTITKEGLNVGAIASAWATPSSALNDQFSKAFKLSLEVKMTHKVSGGKLAALFTKGSFHSGFRILVNKRGQLLFQMARMFGLRPLDLLTKYRMPLNKWVKILVTYSAPTNGNPGVVTFAIEGQKEMSAKVPRKINNDEVNRVIGIGCQFNEMPLVIRKKRKYYPNFPGIIRNIFIAK